jgi:hypothetical protein
MTEDLERYRADARLRMYEGVLETLAFLAADAEILRAAAATTDGTEMPHKARGHYQPTEDEQKLARGRNALLRAAGMKPSVWAKLPNDRKGGVLRSGAIKLGLMTE